MAKGKSGYVSFSGSNGYKMRVYYEQTYDDSTLKSTVTIPKISIQSGYYSGVAVYVDGVIKINGTTVSTFLGNHGVIPTDKSAWYDVDAPDGTTTITHGSDGSAKISISIHNNKYSRFHLLCSTDSKYDSDFVSTSASVALTPVPVYTLKITKDSGSEVSVSRTYSPAGSTGSIANGEKLWKDDKIKITFTPKTNYKIISSKVNGESFVSGNTHTVASNVTIDAKSQPLASVISATDANIGSASTIVVTRYDTSYTHTITYTFGELTGTIVSKGTSTTISWTLPQDFYSQIPNAKSAECTFTCSTYSGSTLLGTSSYTITATASSASCSPGIAGSVEDSDENTLFLTGDSSVLIRYKSDALCKVSASAKNESSILATSINGTSVSSDGELVQLDSHYNEFVFSTTDSRGYSASITIRPTMIPYVRLTINPVIERTGPTTGEVALSFNGNYYNGSFGAYDNTLTIRYRYRKSSDPAFGTWEEIPRSSYAIGTSSYYTNSPVIIGSDFDYKYSYVFEIEAYDGANDIPLDVANVICPLQKGLPVFDWGEDDFNFNVAVKINDINIYDLFYPVSSVYSSVSSIIPDQILLVGEWSQIESNESGIYKWKRIS